MMHIFLSSEALKHAGYAHDVEVEIKWINAEHVDITNIHEALKIVKVSSFQVALESAQQRENLLQSPMQEKIKFHF
jgi:CTP synthase (UTP-ammonia lyase)